MKRHVCRVTLLRLTSRTISLLLPLLFSDCLTARTLLFARPWAPPSEIARLDPPQRPEETSRVRKELCIWVANSLGVIVLVIGALITPGTVLCIGAGHHCHLENPIGDSCSAPLPTPKHSPYAGRIQGPANSDDFANLELEYSLQ